VKRSVERILTTHVGSLPRPNDLVDLYRDDAPDSKLLPRLQSAIGEVVRQQHDVGVDVVNDGEFGKAKGMRWESPRGPISIDPETRDIINTVYIRRVEKICGQLRNVEIAKIDNVKDPVKERMKK
jgi:hypothetical protein